MLGGPYAHGQSWAAKNVWHIVSYTADIAHSTVYNLPHELNTAFGVPGFDLNIRRLKKSFEVIRSLNVAFDIPSSHVAQNGRHLWTVQRFGAHPIVLSVMFSRTFRQNLCCDRGDIGCSNP